MQISTAIRNSSIEAFDDANGGTFRIYNSGNTLLASLNMSATAFGTPSNGTITANAITGATVSTGGTASYATLHNSSGTEICRFTVGTSGAEINLTSLTLVAGDTFNITSLIITLPAS